MTEFRKAEGEEKSRRDGAQVVSGTRLQAAQVYYCAAAELRRYRVDASTAALCAAITAIAPFATATATIALIG